MEESVPRPHRSKDNTRAGFIVVVVSAVLGTIILWIAVG